MTDIFTKKRLPANLYYNFMVKEHFLIFIVKFKFDMHPNTRLRKFFCLNYILIPSTMTLYVPENCEIKLKFRC